VLQLTFTLVPELIIQNRFENHVIFWKLFHLIQGKRKITDGIVILHCKNYFFLINSAIFEVFVPKWQNSFFKMGSTSPQQWYTAHKIGCGVGHIG
jgi:uncharacterized membrane protein